MSDETLTPAELVEATGKTKPAAQAAVLAKRGIPFAFLGRAVRVQRAVAQAHALIPEKTRRGGVDLAAVR